MAAVGTKTGKVTTGVRLLLYPYSVLWNQVCLLIFLESPCNCSKNETQEASGLCSQCTSRKRPAYCNCTKENLLTCAVGTVFFILFRFCGPTKSQIMAMYVIGKICKKIV